MTKEEKQLLLIDLCARLPYGVIVKENDGVNENDNKLLDIDMFDGCINYDYIIEDIKPYLRPMESMTDEEILEFIQISDSVLRIGEKKSTCILSLEQMDWLNVHHFDYRIDPSTGKTLIESNLAIEAPKDMYKTE